MPSVISTATSIVDGEVDFMYSAMASSRLLPPSRRTSVSFGSWTRKCPSRDLLKEHGQQRGVAAGLGDLQERLAVFAADLDPAKDHRREPAQRGRLDVDRALQLRSGALDDAVDDRGVGDDDRQEPDDAQRHHHRHDRPMPSPREALGA